MPILKATSSTVQIWGKQSPVEMSSSTKKENEIGDQKMKTITYFNFFGTTRANNRRSGYPTDFTNSEFSRRRKFK